MKIVLNIISEVLGWIFGYGMMICLFVGGLSFFAYVVALIVGGDTATEICKFIYKDLYKYLVYVTSALVLVGLLKMYISGQTALTTGKKEKAEKKEEPVVQEQKTVEEKTAEVVLENEEKTE